VDAHYNVSMGRRVAATISLVCSAAPLVLFASGPLAAGAGVASPTASLAATGAQPPMLPLKHSGAGSTAVTGVSRGTGLALLPSATTTGSTASPR
jgi:hypothetical protein